MDQVPFYGDKRNLGFCVHCGGPDETVDHVPSKVFLEEPYPENLMASPACRQCNNGFSADEEYLACLVECVVVGEVDLQRLRPKVARILDRSPALLMKLQRARSEAGGSPTWAVESNRASKVVLKLARCHAAYELNEPQIEEPAFVTFKPLPLMADEERAAFEGQDGQLALWPEVGSRAMQRLFVLGNDVFSEVWLVVQDGNYRYRVSQLPGMVVKMVIREYLACEVGWE
jgi:hypothetical protein